MDRIDTSCGRPTIRTPESVVFSYDRAGVASRAVALLVDSIIQIIILVVLAGLGVAGTLLFKEVGAFVSEVRGVLPLTWMVVILLFLAWLDLVGYFIFFEAAWRGQTPGKRLLRIRVVRDEGYPIGFWESLLRNVLRLLDILPTSYALGLLVMLINGKEKRLGDIVAGTMVIREGKVDLEDADLVPTEVSDAARQLGELGGLTRLSEEQYVLVRQFLRRRATLEPKSRAAISNGLASQLAAWMGFHPPHGMSAELFLEAVVYQWLGPLGGAAPDSSEGRGRIPDLPDSMEL